MKTPKEIDISLTSAAFTGLRADFEAVLSRTLSSMQQQGVDSAAVKLNLKIDFRHATANNPRVDGLDATRDMIMPEFEHKVTSILQTKDEAVGKQAGNFELVFDSERQSYVIREVISPQMTIFDDYRPQ